MELKSPNITPVGASLTIWFDGKAVPALPDETIAAALARQNIVAIREDAR